LCAHTRTHTCALTQTENVVSFFLQASRNKSLKWPKALHFSTPSHTRTLTLKENAVSFRQPAQMNCSNCHEICPSAHTDNARSVMHLPRQRTCYRPCSHFVFNTLESHVPLFPLFYSIWHVCVCLAGFLKIARDCHLLCVCYSADTLTHFIARNMQGRRVQYIVVRGRRAKTLELTQSNQHEPI